jgi:hypothetical protein
VAEGDPTPQPWERWYSLATTFVAPATFLSALLFYFGYVSSREQLAYFGVDVDSVGLSTRDYVMRSPQALLVPGLLIPLLAVLAVLAGRRLEARVSSPAAVRRVRLAGLGLGATGLVLLGGYAWWGAWPPYAMVTPLVLAAGLLVLTWLWHRTGASRTLVALGAVVVALCVFWSTATLAQWTGLGAAKRTGRHLDSLPAVVLDTRERLFTGIDGEIVRESRLPADEDQEFRYRYRGLRLLVQSGDRMFLVPERWTPTGSTLLVLVDEVRVRFRFVDDPP